MDQTVHIYYNHQPAVKRSPSAPVQKVRNAKYIATLLTLDELGVLVPVATISHISHRAVFFRFVVHTLP
jgi:hypothetical protein